MECNELQQQGEENCTFYLEGVGCREQESFTTFLQKNQSTNLYLQRSPILNMNSLKNNNKMETKVVSFEQLPELIQIW